MRIPIYVPNTYMQKTNLKSKIIGIESYATYGMRKSTGEYEEKLTYLSNVELV